MKHIKKEICINNDVCSVDLVHPVVRWKNNPILTASDVNEVWTEPQRKVVTVHNAGICRYRGKILMLFRSHLRNGISVIGLAESDNGIDDWKVNSKPALLPCGKEDNFAPGVDPVSLRENEAGGVEDPRITKISDTYYITYSAYHGMEPDRVRVSLASTKDFKEFIRFGPVIDTDMRNVVIFPEKINNKYVAMMRPNDNLKGGKVGGLYKEIRLAFTDNIEMNDWELAHEPVMKQKGGPSPFKDKIGPGAPPIRTSHGWISIFHGVRATMDGNPYVLGVALHDLNDPASVKISNIPVLFPAPADCLVSSADYRHVPQVVFTCGAIRNNDGSIYIYYGGNDTVMNIGISHEDILAELCLRYPQNQLTGEPLYEI